MISGMLADSLLLLHALFVVFVLLGGLLVLRHPRLLLWHLSAVVWGVLIELGGCVCPLTRLENRFRGLAGESGYGGSCVEHYLEPLLYPIGLTDQIRYLLALLVVATNLAIYYRLWRRRRS